MVSALLIHSESLRADFLFSTRFSTPKTTPPTPTPKTSYTSLKSSHSSMMLKALLSKSKVNWVFLYPLVLNQLVFLWSLRCLLTYHIRKSSMIPLEGIFRQREFTQFFNTTENMGIFKDPVCFSRSNSSIERALLLFSLDLLSKEHAIY